MVVFGGKYIFIIFFRNVFVLKKKIMYKILNRNVFFGKMNNCFMVQVVLGINNILDGDEEEDLYVGYFFIIRLSFVRIKYI